jgi:hypothetical protein
MTDYNSTPVNPEYISDEVDFSSITSASFDYSAIRLVAKSFEDSQKVRLATENRVLQIAAPLAGVDPLARPEKGSKEAKENEKKSAAARDKLVEDFTELNSKMQAKAKAGEEVTITPTRIRRALAECKFPHGLILRVDDQRLITVVGLLSQLEQAKKAEKQSLAALSAALSNTPIWKEYLSSVIGCGPSIAGKIISTIDISRAQYPSSLWKLAGYDVAGDGRGRSRKTEHMEDMPYIDKDGKDAIRKGLTFNPHLKTACYLFVISAMKNGSKSPYEKVYRDTKHRLENHVVYGVHNDGKEIEGKGRIQPGRRHAMAIRAAAKRFLSDLYVAWRTLEGLPVAPEYSEAKLGMVHGSADKYAA